MDLLWDPDSENSNRLLTEEKGLGVPDLELMVPPCAIDYVVLEYVGHVVGGNEGKEAWYNVNPDVLVQRKSDREST
ncbi:hypothetical protein TB2_031299 [Malus domestica]